MEELSAASGFSRRVLRRLQLPDPDPAVVAQGLLHPDDAAVLRPPPEGHVSVQVRVKPWHPCS